MSDLKVYDENTFELIETPDLERGFLYDGSVVTGRTEDREEVMEGTIDESCPEGLKRFIPGEDIVEKCKLYHTYTENDKEVELQKKETELSDACNLAIRNGSMVQLSNGEQKKFSYSIEDQANVSEMFNAVLMGVTSYPYHADGESCMMYSAEDIVRIYSALSSLKTAQTTYYNQMRQYMWSLDSVAKIKSIQYGDSLTGEYMEKYSALVQQAGEEMQKVLSKVTTLAG